MPQVGWMHNLLGSVGASVLEPESQLAPPSLRGQQRSCRIRSYSPISVLLPTHTSRMTRLLQTATVGVSFHNHVWLHILYVPHKNRRKHVPKIDLKSPTSAPSGGQTVRHPCRKPSLVTRPSRSARHPREVTRGGRDDVRDIRTKLPGVLQDGCLLRAPVAHAGHPSDRSTGRGTTRWGSVRRRWTPKTRSGVGPPVRWPLMCVT